MQINTATKSVGELALEVPNAITVLEKWKIDYCCKGHRSIDEACATAGVSTDALLAEIGTGRPAGGDTEWQNESLAKLQRYVVDTHHVFTRDVLETIKLLAEKVAMRHGPHHPETLKVREIALNLYNDLMPHMMKEEQVLFPYIESMEKALAAGQEPPVPFFGTVKNPIRMMMNEHDAAGDMLVELRAVTSDYKLPADACLSFRALYERLMDLEQDLHRHIHLENNLLFPRAAEMEEGVRPVAPFENHHHDGRCCSNC